jgi:outer membrane protein assembly factor BamB
MPLTLCRILALTVLTAAAAHAADWPNWRGPNHDGIAPAEPGLEVMKSVGAPRWEAHVGDAFASFAVVGDRVYTGGTENDQQVLVCLNADDGKPVWTKALERGYRERQGGDGPRATPTVDGDRVYMLGALGKLVCVKADDGEEVWSTQLNAPPQWGYSASPLVEGDLLVVVAGKTQGSLLALNKHTGEQVWKAGDDIAGYATPYPFTLDGRRYIVGFLGNTAMIVEAESGRSVWSLEWRTDFSVNAAAPIVHDGRLFLSSGYGHGAALYALRAEGDKLAGKRVWENRNIRNKFQSTILYDGALYTSDEKGLKCVRWTNGQTLWEIPRERHGTMVIAGDQIVFLSEEGQLQVAKASPANWRTSLTASVLEGRCWTAPVLANGRLYVRHLSTVKCFDIPQP